MKQCSTCIVSGRVQGVFYRVSTQQKAQTLGLTGHAKNLSNGNVEVFMCGDTDSISALQKWLSTGPAYAEVSDVQCIVVDDVIEQIPPQFITL